MNQHSKQFAKFCETEFNLNQLNNYQYESLPICIVDCVYSLRVKYVPITLPIVERYANAFMGGNKNASGDTIDSFINNINNLGGPKQFANLLQDHHKLGGKSAIPKEDICYQLAKYLKLLHINTIDDFKNYESQELLEVVIKAVKGMGDAGVNYLFMLAGDEDRCKPDVHIHHSIKDAIGKDVSNEDCQTIYSEAVTLLKPKYPNLTVRNLDGIVWKKYSNK